MYHIPNALTEDELVPNRNEYHRLQDTTMNIFHRLWEPNLKNQRGQTNIMPGIIDTNLTNNATDSLHKIPDLLNLTDQTSAFFQNRTLKSLSELRCWLLLAKCIGDRDIPEVANPTKVRKANHIKYLTAQTRIKISEPNYLFSHHEKIYGMNCYTKNRMIDLIRWSTPTLDYNPAKWETNKIALYPKTSTPHDFNKRWDKASKYLMGEDTARRKSLF